MPPSVTHLLIHTGTIQRVTPVDQGHGRWLETPVDLYTNTRCRVQVASTRERLIAKQEQTLAKHVGYFEPGTDIKRGDMLVNVTREDGTLDPVNYRVTGLHHPSIAHHVKVELEEVQKGVTQ